MLRTHVDPAVGPDRQRLDARHRPEPLVLVGLHLLGVVVLPRLDAGLAGAVVGHREEVQLVHVGDPLAAQAIRRLRATGVAVEPRQLDVAVRAVLDEPERPGADVLLDGVVPGGVDDLLGIDRRRGGELGQGDQERRRRLPKPDLDRRGPACLDRLHRPEDRLAGAGHLAPASERGDHVGRGQLLAVVEPDSLAEPDHVTLGAVQGLVALGEERHRLVLRVQREEGLDHVEHDLAGDHRRGHVHVQGGRLADQRDLQHAALPRRGLGGRRRDEAADQAGQDQGGAGQTESAGSSHRGSSSWRWGTFDIPALAGLAGVYVGPREGVNGPAGPGGARPGGPGAPSAGA